MSDENREIFLEKVKLGKFSTESEMFFEIRGKSETEGKCIIASGGGRPCLGLICLGKSMEDFTARNHGGR